MEYSQEEGEWVFPDNYEVNAGQENGSMNDESDNDSDHVHAQLPGNHLQILDGDDLTTDQAGNTERRVPDETMSQVKFSTCYASCTKHFIFAKHSVKQKRFVDITFFVR